MTASTPMVTTFVIYILGMLAIGFIAYRATANFSDYILGGRSIGSFVTALSAGASDMSGWLLMGLPGAIFISGLSESWIAVGLTLGAYLNWLLIAGRLRVHTEHQNNALTLPVFFSHRFDDHSRILRVVSSLVILAFFTIYCASGVVAGARLFESSFGFSYPTAMLLGAAATIIYVFVGGYLAVSWTDTIQASLMIFALILVPVFVILSIGDIGTAIDEIRVNTPEKLNFFTGVSAVGVISALAWGLGYFGQPHILVRFMAASSAKVIPSARRTCMVWMILCLAGAVAVGFFGISYFADNPQQAGGVNANSERVFIELTQLLFNPCVAGIILSAILAAVMSTLSAQLLVCSSSITEDLYRPFLRPGASEKELMWVGRMMVLVISVIAILIASDPNSLVLGLVSYAWAGFGAAFGPLIILSLMWRGVTRNGALAGMLTGAAVVAVWGHYGWLGLYEMVPGFIASTAAILIFSKIGKGPSAEMIERFDAAHEEYLASHGK